MKNIIWYITLATLASYVGQGMDHAYAYLRGRPAHPMDWCVWHAVQELASGGIDHTGAIDRPFW